MRAELKRFISLPVAMFVVVLAAVTSFMFVGLSATSAGAVTSPRVTFTMFDNTCSFGGPCRERIKITSNPSNYSTRGYVNCFNAIPNTQFTVVSNWITSVGNTAETASCGNLGRSSSAGFEFRKTNTLFVQCWFRGGSWGPAGC